MAIEGVLWADVAPVIESQTYPTRVLLDVWTATETADSRAETVSPCSYHIELLVTGTDDDFAVAAIMALELPLAIKRPCGDVYRDGIDVEPDGYKRMYVTADYKEGTGDGSQLSPHAFTFNFDTQGGSVKMRLAKEHIATYEIFKDGPQPGVFHRGAIDVREGHAEGTEVVIPGLKLGYSYKHRQGDVHEGFSRLLAGTIGKTNSKVWRTFQPGELLYIGGGGSDGEQNDSVVSYNFLAQPNESSVDVGGIAVTGGAKGHELVWAETVPDVDGDASPISKASAVHVEQVYEEADFLQIFTWG